MALKMIWLSWKQPCNAFPGPVLFSKNIIILEATHSLKCPSGFIALFVVGYFLKYPETVKAPIWLETSNPPVEISAMISGTVKPFFKEQTNVERNNTLSQVKNINSGNAAQILALDSMLMQYNKKGFVTVPDFKEMDKWDLGPVKGDYLKFYQAFFLSAGRLM